MQSRAVLLRSLTALLLLSPRAAKAALPAAADDPHTGKAGDAAPAAGPESPRAESLREQSSVSGGTGLLHLQDPLGGAPGTFRVGLLVDSYKGSGFLCTPSTPCAGVTADLAGHFGTTFNLAVTPVSFLEASASLDSYVNSNDARSPSAISAVGNTTFGLKGFTPEPLAGALRFGGAIELGLLGSSGVVGVAGSGTSVRVLGLAQADFRGADRQGVPLRARLNFGYSWNNSSSLVDAVEKARGVPVSRIERFGLEIDRVDQVQMGLGLDGLFGVARPFVEWNVGVPVNRQGYRCYPQRSFSGDGCLATDAKLAAFPSRLTLGARFFPWLDGLSATAALDIGTSGTSRFIEELAPTMPWDLWLGVGYAFDATPPAPAPVVIERPAPKLAAPPPPVELRLRGLVHEQGKTEGIAKAIVTYDGRDVTGMVSGPDGRFVSQGLEPGTYTLLVEAPGYEAGRCEATLERPAPAKSAPPTPATPPPATTASDQPPAPRYVDVDCELKAVPPFGTLNGTARDLVALTPLAGVNVKLKDTLGRELSVTTDPNGAFHVDHVPPGIVTLAVEAEGYLARGTTAEVPARAEVRIELGLRRRPKAAHVTRTPTELVLSQPIRFDEGAVDATPDSTPVLEELADQLLKSPGDRVEIQTFTDASGDTGRDTSLTQARATSLKNWLTAHGVEEGRLTPHGFGSSRPVSPNVTPAGRARNRRVKLMLLQ